MPEAMISGLASGTARRELSRFVSLAANRSFPDLSPAELLPSQRGLPGIGSPLGEHLLTEALLAEDGKVQEEVGPAIATLLLCVILARYSQAVHRSYENWILSKIHDSYRDVSLPSVIRHLDLTLGSGWWGEPIGRMIEVIVRRFVANLHEAMIYERGGYATALLRRDGKKLLWTGHEFPVSTAGNPRLASALQILVDLGYAAASSADPTVLKLTPAGRARLARGLEAVPHA
jgi:hypothetical protein